MHLSKKHGNTIDIIKKEGFKISSKFEMIPKKDEPYDMATTLGHGIINFSKIFKKMKPDINLILGDRDEVFASAIAASHMNILMLIFMVVTKLREILMNTSDMQLLRYQTFTLLYLNKVWRELFRWVKTRLMYFSLDLQELMKLKMEKSLQKIH